MQFFVSGATFYEGRREWGHVYKYLWVFIFLEFPISVVGTLIGGLAAIWLTKRWGPILAPRLVASAATIGLLSVGSFVLLLRFPLTGLIILPISAACLASFLALEFVLVGGLPWGQRDASIGSPSFSKVALVADRLVVASATVVVVGGTLLMALLAIITLQHGCDCG